MAYCKIGVYSELLESDLPEDPYLAFDDLRSYFPAPLPERYGPQMRQHRLRREIIATVIANQLVDRAGSTFVFRLEEETGASASTLAQAFAVAREVFEMPSYWAAVEALDNQVPARVQLEMLLEGRKLVERATRRLVHINPGSIDISFTMRYFKPGAELLAGAIPDVLSAQDRERWEATVSELTEAGVGSELARWVARLPVMLPAFDIIDVAEGIGRDPQAVMDAYFALGARLELDWLRDRVLELPRGNRWQALARAALRDDLGNLRGVLTREVLSAAGPELEGVAAVERWAQERAARIERVRKMLADIRSAQAYDTTTLPVALREVRNLAAGTGAGGPSSRTGSVTLVS
jgi:glutamate dehydrogenase